MAIVTGKQLTQVAEYHVFSELVKRGVAVYRPLLNEGSDILAKLTDGQVLEAEIKTSVVIDGKPSSRFQLPDYQPSPTLFILCVTLQGCQVDRVWVLPSMVFYAYSTAAGGKHKSRRLDLDSGESKYDTPLGDYLRGFRNRWELIADYSEYRRFMASPEELLDLEDLVTAKEAFERPDSEKVPWEDYAGGANQVSN